MSAGLSSTIRISRGVFIFSSMLYGCLDGKSELEVGSATGLRRDPDAPTMLFDNLLADRKPDTIPGIFRTGMQTPEDDEDVLCLLGCDANPVVPHGEDPLLCRRFRVHLN